MKRLMMLLLLMVLMLLFGYTVFPNELQKILYEYNGLIITKTKAIYKGKVLYDAEEEHKKIVEIYGEADASYIGCYYTPLSLIGPYLSYKYDYIDDGAGGGQYTKNEITVKTINIMTNQPASVLELVDEASLVAALKKDCWIREKVII